MSVIMGIKTDNIIILGADKRLVTYKNEFVSDDANKIVVMNKHLAIACSGNKAVQYAIELTLKELNYPNELFVEDVQKIVRKSYKKLKKEKLHMALNNLSYFLVGGIDKKQKLKLQLITCCNGKTKNNDVKSGRIVIPPNNVEAKVCMDIFESNYLLYTDKLFEKTIKDISEKSSTSGTGTVSKCGSKWVYDINCNQSEMKHFD